MPPHSWAVTTVAALAVLRPPILPVLTEARAVLARAAVAMGGEANLRRIVTVRYDWRGYRNLLEQSERPDGPWIPQIEQGRTMLDWSAHRWAEAASVSAGSSSFERRTVLVGGFSMRAFGDRWTSGSAGVTRDAEEQLVLSPIRALLDALDDDGTRLVAQREIQGTPHYVLQRTWLDAELQLFFNADTGLPTGIELKRAYPDNTFWQIWGDVTTDIWWSYWDLIPGGYHLPRQVDVVRNGLPWTSVLLNDIRLNVTPPEDVVSVPADVMSAARADRPTSLEDPVFGSAQRPATELVPGIVLVPGSWGLVIVKQDDGVVVIEAPISAAYSQKAIDEARRRFPDQRMTAVVSTSDSWPHFGGIREYVARGVPVYALDANIPILRRALMAPHTLHPDLLARRPQAPRLNAVSSATTVGAGPNRCVLYPIRSETGERMMMVYWPEHRLLYGSDLVQMSREGPPQYLSELVDAVKREGIEVDAVFAMHSEPTRWAQVLGIVENIRRAGDKTPAPGRTLATKPPVLSRR